MGLKGSENKRETQDGGKKNPIRREVEPQREFIYLVSLFLFLPSSSPRLSLLMDCSISWK